MSKAFVAYYRVSTQRQGRRGLGIEAQRAAVAAFVADSTWTQLAAFEEHESGKGANALDRRPQLRAALNLCKKQRATLLIAKLDRLARNVHFITGLIEAGVEFVAIDMPTATKAMLQIYAVMAEHERDQISARTRAALAAAKARGVRLGVTGPANLCAHVEERQTAALAFSVSLRDLLVPWRDAGVPQREIAARMNRLGIKTPRGSTWTLVQVQRVLSRLPTKAAPISTSALTGGAESKPTPSESRQT